MSLVPCGVFYRAAARSVGNHPEGGTGIRGVMQDLSNPMQDELGFSDEEAAGGADL